MDANVTKGKKARIREITILAMFTSIILLMIFVPYFGFITIFGIPSVTLIHIPVLIGGAMLGRKAGGFLGLIFGVGSLIRAMTSTGLDYLFIFPWVSVLPRVIFGFMIYDVVRLMEKIVKIRILALAISFALLSVIHTLMVLPMLVSTFPIALGSAGISDVVGDLMAFVEANASIKGLITIISSVFLTNGAIEAALAATVGAVIADRLIAFKKNNDNKEELKGGDADAGIN
jgi:uncharacterized membrane protein